MLYRARFLALTSMFALLTAPSAEATILRLSGEATIYRLQTYPGDFQTPGVAIGDKLNFSLDINTDTARERSPYDLDPNYGVYDHVLTNVTFSINDYVSARPLLDPTQSGIIISNAITAYDLDTFYVFSNDFSSISDYGPFGVGQGSIAESFQIAFFDFTRTLTSSDSLQQQFDLGVTSYRNVSVSIGDRSRNGGRDVLIDATIDSFRLDALVVPEPATWAMMLVGFGMIGTTLRYRRRKMKVAYS